MPQKVAQPETMSVMVRTAAWRSHTAKVYRERDSDVRSVGYGPAAQCGDEAG